MYMVVCMIESEKDDQGRKDDADGEELITYTHTPVKDAATDHDTKKPTFSQLMATNFMFN